MLAPPEAIDADKRLAAGNPSWAQSRETTVRIGNLINAALRNDEHLSEEIRSPPLKRT